MCTKRILLLILGSALTGSTLAQQAIMAKNLIVSLGGGGGITSIASNSEMIAAGSLESSAVRFAFSYALSDRFSMGGHYDRIGSVVHPVLDRVRFTSYMIEGNYRIHNGRSAALEVAAAAGMQSSTLRPKSVLLPFDARGFAINASVRYLHLINQTIGVSLAFDHIMTTRSDITFGNDPISLENGDRVTILWKCPRLTIAGFLRF